MTYVKITKAADLEGLDHAELIEGYYDGSRNEPEPKGNRSQSYYHGWRNGMTDFGHALPDEEQRLLVADYVALIKEVRK